MMHPPRAPSSLIGGVPSSAGPSGGGPSGGMVISGGGSGGPAASSSSSSSPVIPTGVTITSTSISSAGLQQTGSISVSSKSIQTDLTGVELAKTEAQACCDLENRNTRIDELSRTNEELKHQMSSQSKGMDDQKAHISKCIDVSPIDFNEICPHKYLSRSLEWILLFFKT